MTSPPRPACPTCSDLVRRATDDPWAVLSEAAAHLQSAGAGHSTHGRQARGVALRELGRLAEARQELASAARSARAAGEEDLLADIRATLAVVHLVDGRPGVAVRTFEAALAGSSGLGRARVQVRYGLALAHGLNRPAAGIDHLNRALPVLARSADRVWEATALLNRSHCWSVDGRPGSAARADRDARRAAELFTRLGQDTDAARAVHNRGAAARLAGAIPVALRHLGEAGRRYEQLGLAVPELAEDRCRTLLAAGLARDALQEADSALRLDPPLVYRLPLLLLGATSALAAGDPDQAASRAREASTLARRARRNDWAARAAAIGIRARVAVGENGAVLAHDADRVARTVLLHDPVGAPLAELVAGRIATAPGSSAAVRATGLSRLRSASRARSSSGALDRAGGWLAEALLRTESGGRVLTACSRGLAAVEELVGGLGATEVRAAATGHGTQLARLAVRTAAREGSAADLLRWAERWRAVATTPRPVRPPADEVLAAQLGALRSAAQRLEAARAAGTDRAGPEREVARAELAVRRRRAQVDGAGAAVMPRLDRHALRAELGVDTVLVELVDVDGVLHAVTVASERMRRSVAGTVAAAQAESAHARLALLRAAHGRPVDLAAAGRRLSEAVLGDVRIPDGRAVVLAPPAPLLALPWGLLPALWDRPVSVNASAAMWLGARRAEPAGSGRTVLVLGPDLPGAAREVADLSRLLPGAEVLSGSRATAAAVSAALDGAALAHLACHGSFRDDNPLFSSLAMTDGPLWGYDLDALPRPPGRVVLAACESAEGASVTADEVLSLAGALLAGGSRGVLAAVGPVGDAAAAAVMADVHRCLRDGRDLPTAMSDARARASSGPEVAAAAAMVALGN